MSDTWIMGIVLNLIILVIISIPCAGVAWLGSRMINKLGYYPSQNAPIQMSILIPLLILEIFSYITFILINIKSTFICISFFINRYL